MNKKNTLINLERELRREITKKNGKILTKKITFVMMSNSLFWLDAGCLFFFITHHSQVNGSCLFSSLICWHVYANVLNWWLRFLIEIDGFPFLLILFTPLTFFALFLLTPSHTFFIFFFLFIFGIGKMDENCVVEIMIEWKYCDSRYARRWIWDNLMKQWKVDWNLRSNDALKPQTLFFCVQNSFHLISLIFIGLSKILFIFMNNNLIVKHQKPSFTSNSAWKSK